jgi:hypothetical protein
MPSAASEPQVLEPVQVRAGSSTDPLGVGGRSGLVVDKRRGRVQVLFLEDQRSIWVDNEMVRRYVPDSIPREHLLGFVVRFLRLFPDAGPPEVEVGVATGRNRITVPHGAMDVAEIDAVREFLGGDLVSMTLAPAGMRRLTTTVEWRAAS